MTTNLEKTYVVKVTKKDAIIYFAGQYVQQGIYNGKKAAYVDASYISPYENIMGKEFLVHSAKPGNKYLGRFISEKMVPIELAKGLILVAK